jgi:hypothetical protein
MGFDGDLLDAWWVPGTDLIAFLGPDNHRRPQIYLVKADGTHVRQLTKCVDQATPTGVDQRNGE